MSEERAVTWANAKVEKADKRQRFIVEIKCAIYMKWHSFYWKVLHLTRLARPYSKTMCFLNLYRTFPDGRCMWCGNKHGGLSHDHWAG